jgi:hypothetical protein
MFISILHAIFDGTHLGVFTGSQLGKYGQSRCKKGTRFNTVPRSVDAGEWAGCSLAFIAANFIFFSPEMIAIPHLDVPSHHTCWSVVAVQIRFGYDKSKDNFITQKFSNLDHPFLNPIDAAVAILCHTQFLGVPAEEPLGVSRSLPGAYSFIKDSNVTDVMCHTCELAYPNPQHHLRLDIKCLVAHSNWVT